MIFALKRRPADLATSAPARRPRTPNPSAQSAARCRPFARLSQGDSVASEVIPRLFVPLVERGDVSGNAALKRFVGHGDKTTLGSDRRTAVSQ
jgi:hypothetical protein